MIVTVKDIGPGFVVTNEGQFTVAASYSDPLYIGETVIVMDGTVIASVDGSSNSIKQILDFKVKKFGTIILSAVKGAIRLASSSFDLNVGKFQVYYVPMGDDNFTLRLTLGNIILTANADSLSVKYPQIFELDVTVDNMKLYLYKDISLKGALLKFIADEVAADFGSIKGEGEYTSLKLAALELIVDSVTTMIGNLSMRGVNYIVDFTGNVKLSGQTASLSSRDNTEINATLGSVIVTGSQGIAISAVPGLANPLTGMVTIDAPGFVKIDAPQVMLTGSPIAHSANAEYIVNALTAIMAAISALAPFTTSPQSAATAVTGALSPALTAMPLIPNARVWQ